VNRWLLLIVLTLIGAGAAPASGQLRAPASGARLPAVEEVGPGRLERLEQWLKAAARHAAGEDDEALTEAAAWPNSDLKKLGIEVNALVQIIRLPPDRRPTKFSIRSENQKTQTLVRYTPAQLRRLTVLACAAGGGLDDPDCITMRAADELDADFRRLSVLVRAAKVRGDDNYIVRRGALLHGDVAMLAPLSMEAPGDVWPTGGLERFRMEISDGQEVDFRQSAVHWEMARMILDFVRPRGLTTPIPATTTWSASGIAPPRRGCSCARITTNPSRSGPRDLPRSGHLLLSASQRETYGGVPIQTAVRSAVLPTGVTIDVEPRRGVASAEGLFQRVLELRPATRRPHAPRARARRVGEAQRQRRVAARRRRADRSRAAC
jgi:hypothetical protein